MQSNELKYVMNNYLGVESPVVFPPMIKHTDRVDVTFGQPFSAGFCVIKDSKVECYGESISLNLKSRPEDSLILTEVFFDRFSSYS
jgi:hypothetical protein